MDLILTFHSIDASGSVLSYPPDRFRALIEGLAEEGVSFVTMDELLRPAAGDRHRVLLTFDDGFVSVREHALDVLREARAPALLYVVTGWVGRDNRWPSQAPDAPRLELMSWDTLRELAGAGFELGSHTANHVHLDRTPDPECERELADSRARLEDELGRAAPHFAYPYGTYAPDDPARVARHYRTAVTTDMRLVAATDEPCRLPRIDSYYLKDVTRRLPLFGAGTLRYLRLRALARGLRLRLAR